LNVKVSCVHATLSSRRRFFWTNSSLFSYSFSASALRSCSCVHSRSLFSLAVLSELTTAWKESIYGFMSTSSLD
jgi:hypothetical protein